MTDAQSMASPDLDGSPILPGHKAVLELLEERPSQIAKIYCLRKLRERAKLESLARRAGVPLEFRDQEGLDTLLPAGDRRVAHQGLVAILSRANLIPEADLLQSAASAPLPLILALDQVQDPGNVGTLCRSAYALGAAGLLLPTHGSASLGPAAFKSSMGALAKMPVAIATNLSRCLDQAEELGLAIYGAGRLEAGPTEDAFSFAWALPAVLVLGGEQKGLRPGVAKRCSLGVEIPFKRPFDSLNIAQAGAMLLGLCARAQLSP